MNDPLPPLPEHDSRWHIKAADWVVARIWWVVPASFAAGVLCSKAWTALVSWIYG